MFYDIEVKLIHLGDSFVPPSQDSPDFEIISNTITDSFGPVFENLPGYYRINLEELKR